MFDEGMTGIMEYVEAPEQKAWFKRARASRLTAARVLEDVAGWGAQVKEQKVANYLELIDMVPGKDGEALFETLLRAVSNDLRDSVKEEWARLRPVDPNTDPQAVRYEFDDEDECVTAMNKKLALIWIPGDIKYVFWNAEGVPNLLNRRAAEDAMAPYKLYRVVGKKEKVIPGFKVWKESPNRRTYGGMGFYPDTSKKPKDHLNLFTGFAVKPARGDWSLLKDHIRDQICSGNAEQFEYILDLISQLFFEPGVKSGIISAIRGLPGSGKSKLGEWICKIIGPRHSIVLANGDQVTGRFNGHLELMLFILAEEAFFAADPKAGKALKHMATGENYTYESKGVDARAGVNYVRVMMPTNEDWVAPVESFDRRYLVTDCSSARREDKPFFASIDDQMESGGASAMLHEMLERKMTFRNLGKPPMTAAKIDQIRESMTPKMKWLASVLQEGRFMYKEKGEAASAAWPERGGAVEKSSMLSSYQFLVPGYKGPASPEEFGLFLKKHVPNLESTKRAVFSGGQRIPHYVLPSLADARTAFLKANPDYVFETEVEDVPDGTVKEPANDASPLGEQASA